jgi:hypothetical protein
MPPFITLSASPMVIAYAAIAADAFRFIALPLPHYFFRR